jgi:hypothetical protein
MFKHELGKEAKDIVTGFKGIILSRMEWLTGCNRYGIQPKMGKDGKTGEITYFDENQIEVVGKGVIIDQTPAERAKGGPRPNPSKY